MGIEDPDPDVAEQQVPVTDLDDEDLPGSTPLEADPADFADQHREVPDINEDN